MLAGHEGERLWHYWQKQLSGAQTVLNLPASRPRPQVQTYAGANERFRLDHELTAKLKQFAQDYNSTLFTTLLAAFQVLLYRYTGQEDFLVGSPTSGRRAAAFRSVVGYFVNPVALRARVSPEMTFESLHKRRAPDGPRGHGPPGISFGLLVERLQVERDPSRAPLFQVMFSWQQSPLPQQPGCRLLLWAKVADACRLVVSCWNHAAGSTDRTVRSHSDDGGGGRGNLLV